MEPKDCPDSADLEKFVHCSVSEPVSDSISSHLEVCPTCEETVVQMERDCDTVAQHIRRAVAAPTFAHEPECRQLMTALIEQSSAPGINPGQETAVQVPALQNLRDYRIIAKLGEGGMGAVYKAVHQRLKKTVALKVLPSGRMGDKQTVERFEREMSVLGQLNHPNIVQALDAGEHDGQHYLVMEYVEGKELAEIIKRCSPLSIADACCLISQAAIGLQYAHEHGFVHRDIKPSNLMLTAPGSHAGDVQPVVKILDLGLARALEQPTSQAAAGPDLTIAGQVMGTLDYMAPEQGGDSHHVDIRADIYSLGATLYKLLTGDSPFVEHSHKPTLQRLMAIAQNDPPPIRSKRSDVPEKLAAIIHRMLAKKPENRFSTPQEVAEALEPFCAGANLAALLPAHGTTRDVSVTRTYDIPATPAVGSGRRVRKSWIAIASGCAAIAMLAAVLVISNRSGTVEVSSPDGMLPDDVKVVVMKGGEEIELLQADNQWTARIVKGEYQAQLRGGTDKFEIKNSQLIVNRMGKAVITVDIRKPQAQPATTSVATTTPAKPVPETSRPAAETMSPARPAVPAKGPTLAESDSPYFVLRDGKARRSFKSLPGAIADLQAGEIIEVRSNARLRIQLNDRITKPLTIRAGEGFRPLLALVRPERTRNYFDRDVSVANCDLDLREAFLAGTGTQSWIMQGCRVWGDVPADFAKWTVKDCILLGGPSLQGYFTVIGDFPSECVLENCVIRNTFAAFQAEHGQHKLSMLRCTYFSESPYFFQIGPEAKLDIEANDNVLICRSGGLITLQPASPHQTWMTKSLENVNWRGQRNCFAGDQFGVWEVNGEQQLIPKAQGLAAWNKLWKTLDLDSVEVVNVALERERIQQIDGPERLRELRVAMTKYVADHQLVDAGPDWDHVGPGEAYVRALAAEGRPVAEADLRPEQHEAGPFDLLRNGQRVRSFRTLQEAVDAAVDKDEIEIRMDGPTAGVLSSGSSRLLTIRSAAGYAPQIEFLIFEGTDELILEGLSIAGTFSVGGVHRLNLVDPKTTFHDRASVRRIANCSLLPSRAFHADMNIRCRDEKITPEIVNCEFPTIQLGLRANGTAQLKNTVMRTLYVATENNGLEPGHLKIDHCLAFAPSLINANHMNLLTQTATRITSDRTIFVSPADLASMGSTANPFAGWSGSRNVFLKDFAFVGGGAPPLLEQHQAQYKTDLDSVELPPWHFDPAQWRILRDKSAGYQPRPDGTDYGADIDELITIMTLKVRPAAPVLVQ